MSTGMERAKELFLYYSGNKFYMDLNGDGNEYESYRVSRETENEWRREYLDRFLEEKQYGKDALNAYLKAADFLKSDMSDGCREDILYYPFRSGQTDDVTALFMLQAGLRLAERWSEKGHFSRSDAEAYIRALDAFTEGIMKRSEAGTMTRAEDYDMGEFSDPVYTAGYLKDLRDKWSELIRKLK